MFQIGVTSRKPRQTKSLLILRTKSKGMLLSFNERTIDTEEYNIKFDEGCRANFGDISFGEMMTILDITEDEVDFSGNSGDDGLPVDTEQPVDGTIALWVQHYNEKLLEPYHDKETNILMQEIGEDGLQLLYLFHNDLSEDSDYNDEQFEVLDHLFQKMDKNAHAYHDVKSVISEYQEGDLGNEETYVLLKIRFSDIEL